MNIKSSATWIILFFLIAILGGAIFFIIKEKNASLSVPAETGFIQGKVESVNNDEKSFIVTSSLLNNNEKSKPTITIINYFLKWQDGEEIYPHHPRLLRGGEMVKIWPKEKITTDITEYSVERMEILKGPRQEH